MESTTVQAELLKSKQQQQQNDQLNPKLLLQQSPFLQQQQQQHHQQCNKNKTNVDILLNNFQIKKKNYRVLFNCDHLVWERLNAEDGKKNCNNNKSNPNHNNGGNVAQKTAKKEADSENEQLANKNSPCGSLTYGKGCNVVHINEIIRVTKGATKSASLRNLPQTYDAFPGSSGGSPVNSPKQNFRSQPQAAQISTSSHQATNEHYLTIHYAERIVHSLDDCNRWCIRTLTLYNSDPYIVKQWHTQLSKLLTDLATQQLRVQRLLVFINPYGGRKQGLMTYERYCKPMFQLAGIDASCIISQRANQIRDILMSHDLQPFDAVCCVGGDGTVAEVINGLIFRRMRDLNLDMRRPLYIPKPALPIGIIPAGSTDTVAYSLHGTSDARTAAIHLILGQRRGLDICSVRNQDGIVRFCASVLSYGYLGDVAAKSERYRWMGTTRYEYTGVKAFLCNRGYEAEICLQLPPDEEDYQSNPSGLAGKVGENSTVSPEYSTAKDMVCYANCQRCSIASLTVNNDAEGENEFRTEYDNIPTSSSAMTYNTTLGGLNANAQNNTSQSAADETMMTSKDNMLNALKTSDIDMRNCDNDLKRFSNVFKTQHAEKYAHIKDLPNGVQSGKTRMHQINEEDQDQSEETNMPEVNIATTSDIPSTKNEAPKTLAIPTSSSYCSISYNDNSVASTPSLANNPKWKVIKGTFFMISGANISCACNRSPKGIARYSHIGDGYLDLILVRKTSLLNNLRFLLNTVGRDGEIRNLPFVEVYRTRKFHFRLPYPNDTNSSEQVHHNKRMRGSCQPITESVDDLDNPYNEDNVSRWNCDGEVVSDLDITMTSHCQLVSVLMRGPHSFTGEESTKFCWCT